MMITSTALHHHLLLLMLLLLVQLPAPISPAANAADHQEEAAGCQATCGEINITYPFGLTQGCYRTGFQLACNNHSQLSIISSSGGGGEKSSIVVTDIWLNEGAARALNPVFSYYPGISNASTTAEEQPWPLVLPPDGPYSISTEKNVFVLIGCNFTATLSRSIGYDSRQLTGECEASCSDNHSKDDQSCDGSGCCQIPITREIATTRSFAVAIENTSRPYGRFVDQAIAMLVDMGWFNFTYAAYISAGGCLSGNSAAVVPFFLEWAIPAAAGFDCNGPKPDDYACRSDNSVCLNAFNGYRCMCSPGYSGNAYLAHGCQGSPLNRHKYQTIHVVLLGAGIGVAVVSSLASIPAALRAWRTAEARKIRARHLRHNRRLLEKEHLPAYERTKQYSLPELEKATDGFDETRIIGGGGHGTVYKGILYDQRVVAVKRSNLTNKGELKQFVNEVVLLSQTDHLNFVKLIGCCLEAEVPLLVYEFVSNGTLADHLHRRGGTDAALPWEARLRIAAEAAAALAYLHVHASICIFHRDVKSNNILLDDKLTAKVSDFGASRSVPARDDARRQITTVIQGTIGYLDPEYYSTGKLTEKSDVYSFGVILAELLTGEKPVVDVDGGWVSLRDHFLRCLQDGRLMSIVFPGILFVDGDDAAATELERRRRKEIKMVAGLAEACLRTKGEKRPSMKEVELSLQGLLRGNYKSTTGHEKQIMTMNAGEVDDEGEEEDDARRVPLMEMETLDVFGGSSMISCELPR